MLIVFHLTMSKILTLTLTEGVRRNVSHYKLLEVPVLLILAVQSVLLVTPSIDNGKYYAKEITEVRY